MKSSDMVFYDGRNGALQVLYREEEYGCAVLPVCKRDRGSAWGHGNRTIGVYKRYNYNGITSQTTTPENVMMGRWLFEWIDPRHIQVTMEQHFATQAELVRRADERKAAARANELAIKSKFDSTGLPFQTVMEILGLGRDSADYHRRSLLRGERTSLYLNANEILALISAAQKAHPAVQKANVEAEVASALANLAGM